MSTQILTNAAILKGYLIAKDAPKKIVDVAQAIIDSALAARVPNEDVRLPEPSARTPETSPEKPAYFVVEKRCGSDGPFVPVTNLGDLPFTPPEPRPPAVLLQPLLKDEVAASPDAVIAAPETALPEENSEPEDGEEAEGTTRASPEKVTRPSTGRGHNPDNIWEDWQLLKLREMKARGETAGDIAAAVEKTTTQVHNKWTWMRNREMKQDKLDAEGWPAAATPSNCSEIVTKPLSARDEAIAHLLGAMPPVTRAEQSQAKVRRDDIPKILELLGDLEMTIVAQRFGTQGHVIDSLLKRYGIDYRLLPPKSSSRIELPPAEPMMKFKKVAIRDTWGNENEIQVPEPLSVETDPDSGATVTKYPPGYAYGAGPQKNVAVKGGS